MGPMKQMLSVFIETRLDKHGINVRDEKGFATTEYAIALGAIIVAVTAAMVIIGSKINGAVNTIPDVQAPAPAAPVANP